MASSMVSSMVLFLLLLLVFPHIDKALAAQEEAQKQSSEETYHPDGFPKIRVPDWFKRCGGAPACKGDIRLPSPPPGRSFKGTHGPGH